MPCRSSQGHSTARPSLDGRAVALRRTALSEHGMGMASVNQTQPQCVNQIGKTYSKPLPARHGRSMLCVNRPLDGRVSRGHGLHKSLPLDKTGI